MKSASPRLTLALIARDEEPVIARCLESVRHIAMELIVVDTGSTDNTRDIARKAGAKVLEFPWVDDFSAARNASLDAATGQWILALDADEYLPESSSKAIERILTEVDDKHCAFHLLNKSSQDGGRSGMVGKIVRLFPNHPDIRYEWPVHEQVVTSIQRANIPILDTDIEIIHTGYINAEVNRKKQSRNLRILDAFMSSNPSSHPMVYFLQGGALLDLGRPEEALAAYERCMTLVPASDSIHMGALVRRANCLAELHRFEEIICLPPPAPARQWHPELLVLHGHAEFMRGNRKTATELLCLVFDSPDTTSIPAYDPVRVRARAIMMLAEIFEDSSPKASVTMLRLAKESLSTGRKIRLAEVLDLVFL
jgi:glycosyltransferase involved in cell wall biosynthesis